MPEHEDRLEQQLRALAGVGSRSASALPAEEVRARGSRRRQRRVAVVAGVAAAAVVAASTVAVGVGNTAQVAPATPGPVPPGGWLQEVPDGFVIDAEPLPLGPAFEPRVGEMPGREVPVPGCRAPNPVPGPVDALGVATPRTMRAVQLYADAAAAADSFRALVESADQCPGGSISVVVGRDQQPAETPTGRAIVTREDKNGIEHTRLALVGNALAIVQTTPQPNGERLGQRAFEGLVEQMCVFTVAGCDVPPVTPVPELDNFGMIPDDFPLDVALVDVGDGVLEGPRDGLSPVELTICGNSVFPLAEPTNHLGLSFTGPEWGELRSLTTYQDAATARRVHFGIVSAADECDRSSTAPGSYTTWNATSFSSDRGRAVLEQRFGASGIGLDTGLALYSLVQRGSALLIIQRYGEGGSNPTSTQAEFDRLLGATEALLGEMCAFAVGACEADEPTTDPLSDRDLPPARELPSYDNRSDWDETATYPDETQGSISVCQRQPLADLGATQVFSRRYRGVTGALGGALGPGSTGLQVEAGVTIAEFPDEAAAAEAYTIARGWIDECESALDEQGFEEAVGDPLDDVEADEPTAFRVLSYRPGGSTADGTWTDGQAVVQRDNRLALMSARSRGGRLEFFPRLGTPGELVLVAVVDWLPPGNPPPGP